MKLNYIIWGGTCKLKNYNNSQGNDTPRYVHVYHIHRREEQEMNE